jgi:PAS domain S-box-containing protein
LLRRSFYLAQESGDLNYTAYSCDRLVTMLLAAGERLEDVQRETENGIECAQKLRSNPIVGILNGQLRLVRFLRGLMPSVFSFDDGEFNEERFVQQLGSDPHLTFVRCWYWIRKLQALFHAGEYASAVMAGTRVEMSMQATPSFFEAFEYHFYDALARASYYDSAPDREKAAHLTALTAHRRRLQGWAVNGAENFADRAALIAAEIGRIEGRDLEAMHFYEEAIHASRENGFIQNEGIAHELAARFYQARGLERLAQLSLREARHCYFRWGALGKVRLLDQRYPYLGDEPPSTSAPTTIDASLEQLDLEAVLRASQAVSSEIVLNVLIESLMKIVVEHAGAERGHLILLRNHEPRVEAEAEIRNGRITTNVRDSAVRPSDLPEAILKYVIRTRTSVILDDASGENLFSADPYIQGVRVKSVLCLPLLKQAKLIGVLYLENNFVTGVFTPARRSMLELLASQVAISLENARLYADLGRLNTDLAQENYDRRQAEEALRDSEQRLQDIIDNTSAIISVKDLELRYLLVNREYERRYHVRRDQVRGKTDFDIFPPEVAEAIRLNDSRVIEAGEPIEFEEVLPWDGREHFQVAARFLLRGQEGLPYAVCGISTDISERKRAEETLRRAQAALSHITRVMTIGELTASIAHEVNQPLTGIVTNASACMRWLGGSTPNLIEARESLTRIVRDGKRAAEVITRIRALVRKAKSEMAPLNINEALEEVVLLTQFELRKNKVKFDLNLDLSLPPVIADRVQFQQVVLNLLINAIEAMASLEDTSRELQLISRWQEPASVLIAVRDSGIGIGSQPIDELFEAFFTTKAQGMGMGLAISRSIVEAHGGRLWAESNSDRGATFQFTLPVQGNIVALRQTSSRSPL